MGDGQLDWEASCCGKGRLLQVDGGIMVQRSELKGHAVSASSSLAPSKHPTMHISREPELAIDWPAPDNSESLIGHKLTLVTKPRSHANTDHTLPLEVRRHV